MPRLVSVIFDEQKPFDDTLLEGRRLFYRDRCRGFVDATPPRRSLSSCSSASLLASVKPEALQASFPSMKPSSVKSPTSALTSARSKWAFCACRKSRSRPRSGFSVSRSQTVFQSRDSLKQVFFV